MDFELTEGQKLALEMAEGLMRSDLPCDVGVITGFAGTGKTTMLKAIASRFGDPLVLAPTGKAALRVQEATGLEASTLHRWMYRPAERLVNGVNTGEVEYILKESQQIARPGNGLVVVDEASMVGRDLWEHLWNVCQLMDLKVILVGDPFQLAPVEPTKEKDEDSFSPLTMIDTPHRAHLSQITRQAFDNPILRASMMIRESSRIDQALPLLNRVFRKNFDEKCMEVYQGGGAVIVHKNATRHSVNAMVRSRLGYGPDLVPGEPLLVLRNTYEIDRFNGEVVKYDGMVKHDGVLRAVTDKWKNSSKMMSFGVGSVEGKEVLLTPEQVRGETQDIGDWIIAKTSKTYYGDNYAPEGFVPYIGKVWQGPPHLHANFGYALTCHKSQGSEWKQVLVLIETSTRPTTIEGRRWLYTAITRAKESCYFSMET